MPLGFLFSCKVWNIELHTCKEMAQTFSSNSEDVISRKIDEPRDHFKANRPLKEYYELDRCLEFLKTYEKVESLLQPDQVLNFFPFLKVALQFPDNLLPDSVAVATILRENSGKEVFILGDTSYGRC